MRFPSCVIITERLYRRRSYRLPNSNIAEVPECSRIILEQMCYQVGSPGLLPVETCWGHCRESAEEVLASLSGKDAKFFTTD